MLTEYGVRVLGALVLLYVSFKVAAFARSRVVKSLTKASFDTTLTHFFGNMARWLVLIVAILACLGLFGVETTSFAAVLGAAGLAIGLAFQGTLSNFSAGVMLLVFRPFKVGDVVNVGGQVGAVTEIGLFTVSMDTVDNRRLILPNSSVFGATIENITHHDLRRADIDVGCDYSADLDKTREVLEAAAAKVPGGLSEPEPQVFLAGLGGSSVDYQVRVWCKTDDYWDVYQATIREVKIALDDAGIGIPFPQMDVHLDKVGE